MKFQIHPFFLVDVMQMLRHNQQEAAADFVFAELLHLAREREARRKRGSSIGGSDDGDSGEVLLPTPQRCRELRYEAESPSSKPKPTQRHKPENPDEFKF